VALVRPPSGTLRPPWPSLLLIAALTLSACSSSAAPATPPGGSPGSTPAALAPASVSPAPVAGEWEWPYEAGGEFPDETTDEEVDPEGGVGLEAPDSAGLPDGPWATEPDPDADGVEVEGFNVDPCTLVGPDDWSNWIQQSAEVPVSLEGGIACGWRDGDDLLRMAIGVLPALDPANRWLTPAEMAAGEAIDGLGDRAVWLEQWPIPASSTLVIEVGSLDVVIEVSTVDSSLGERLRETALHFAPTVLGRLP
jgi:hypothetical protein